MFKLNHRAKAIFQWLLSVTETEFITGPYHWHSLRSEVPELESSEPSYISVTVSEDDHHDVVLTFYACGSLSGIIMDNPKDPSYLNDVAINKYIDAMFQAGYFFNQSIFAEAITVQEHASIPPGSNPYHHDSIRMGCDIGHHWQAMFYTPQSSEEDPKPCLTELMLINTKTGRRFHLDLTRANELPSEKKKE